MGYQREDIPEKADGTRLSKADFLANMSHELRTPLNGILGLSQLIAEEPNIRIVREYNRQLAEAGRQLKALVDDVLEMLDREDMSLLLNPLPESTGQEKRPAPPARCAALYEHGWDCGITLEGRTVLIAEDHPLNQMILKKLLENRGAEVLTANNGYEAVRLYEQSKDKRIDVILMDIRMPRMDGLTAAGLIRTMEKPDAGTIPIIAMTANVGEEDRKKSEAAGMNAHLAKPIDVEELFGTLAGFLREPLKEV